MTTMTVAEAEARFGHDIDEHLARDLVIPVHTGPQRQGDLLFVPGGTPATTPIPRAGYPVIRGENGGHTHALHTDTGECFYTPSGRAEGRLGVLTVADDSTAVLAHSEHGFMAFGPGTYTVTRQREQADEIRSVAD